MTGTDPRALVAAAAEAMRAFQENRIGFESACGKLEPFRDLDPELVEDLLNTLSEIDGSPGGYGDLLDLLETGPALNAVRAHLAAPF